MGTDIHGWIEFKEETGAWRSSLSIGLPERDYTLFGLMAGVRGVVPALIEPRGLPDDACWYGKERYGADFDHTTSWLTVDELKNVRGKLEGENRELNAWIAAMEALGECRLIFGFDS